MILGKSVAKGDAVSYLQESKFRRFLRKLFTASAEARREIYGSAAAPAPPLHVEYGPEEPERRRGTGEHR
jgi:hypothetical protein